MTEQSSQPLAHRVGAPIIDWVAPVLGLMLPLVAFFASKGAVIVLSVAALASAIDLARGAGRQWPFGRWLPIAAAALLLWAAASVLWEHTHGLALPKTVQLLGLMTAGGLAFVGFGNVSPKAATRTMWALVLGFSIGLAFSTLEQASSCAVSGWPRGLLGLEERPCHLFRYKIGVCVAALLIPALFPALWRRDRRWLAGFCLLLAAGAVATRSNTSIVAAAFGGLAFVAILRWRRATIRVLIATVFAAIVLAPAWVSALPTAREVQFAWNTFPSSLAHRMMIWHFTNQRIAEKPLMGWGADGAREIPGNSDAGEVYLFHPTKKTLVLSPQDQLPLHPHNNGLQVWLEMGVVGALLYTALILALIARLGRLEETGTRAAAFSLLVIALVMGLSSFGVWQSWWLAALWLAASFTRILTRSRACAA